MARGRSTPPPSEPARDGIAWMPLLVMAIAGALLGSTATYLALRPQLRSGPGRAGATAVTAPMPGPGATHPPPAELTAGLSPAQAARALGNFHYDHGNWAEAERQYEEAIRLGQDDADIRTDLGNVYRFSGRAAEALAQYELAQRMNPQHEFSLFNQGGLFLEEMKDPARAVAAWSSYLERFPNGRNADAARQLIAQARGQAMPAPAGPMAGPTGKSANAGPDPTEQRLLDLVTKQPEPRKP